MSEFSFDVRQLLRKPLHERVYFSELAADWVLLTLDRAMPIWWEVEERRYLPSVQREMMGGRYDPAAFFRFSVIVWEVELERGKVWTAQNSFGEIDRSKCETVMLCEAQREPGRWLVDVLCLMEYAVDTFHDLVQRLLEAGGQLAGQSPSVGKKRRKQVDRHALPLQERKKLVSEYRRQTVAGKVSQVQFAETNGISVKTLREYLKEFPTEGEGNVP